MVVRVSDFTWCVHSLDEGMSEVTGDRETEFVKFEDLW